MRPIVAKQGKSKRGQFTPDQSAYIDRCIEFGCIACYLGRGVSGSPACWHHQKQGYHAAGMRAPHEQGLALCEFDHKTGPDSIHRNPKAFEHWLDMSEAELVAYCQKRFNWEG